MPEVSHRPLAHSLEDVRPLHQLCREGRLYDVERWIADGKPLQLTPEAVPKGTRAKTALQVALETGQHSLATLLLRNGYQLELERYAPLDSTLNKNVEVRFNRYFKYLERELSGKGPPTGKL